tara:strand:+ start:621 stop:890 length:270 start_codon:yes stop_codon:yes gene_type:complete
MPRKANRDSRMKVVSARYSEAEHQAVKDYAKSIGEAPTTFMYQSVMKELSRNGAPTKIYPSVDMALEYLTNGDIENAVKLLEEIKLSVK